MQALQQRSVSSACSGRPFTGRLVAPRPAQPLNGAGTSGRSRGLAVTVHAAKSKSKGKSMMRGNPGMQGGGQQQQMMVSPAVDEKEAEIVLFVRAHEDATKNLSAQEFATFPRGWVPLSIFKGGNGLTLLVQSCRTDWGRKLFQKTLIRNLAQNVYQERKNLEQKIRQQFTPFRNTPGRYFEYGMKIRDKRNPKDWAKATADLVTLPSEAVVAGNAVDDLKRLFSPDSLATLFSSPTTPS